MDGNSTSAAGIVRTVYTPESENTDDPTCQFLKSPTEDDMMQSDQANRCRSGLFDLEDVSEVML